MQYLAFIFSIYFTIRRDYMAREKITVTLAGVKMNLITADKDSVIRMVTSLDESVRKIMGKTSCSPENALVMLAMEQSESLKKNADLIRGQQIQIYSLLQRNAALSGEADEAAPLEDTENFLLSENERLRAKNNELLDQIASLRLVVPD